MLGFGNMRQMHDARHEKAVTKTLQQEIDEEAEMEVLDIMNSLKDQFENIKDR